MSVCLSVTLRYREQIGRNSEMFSRLVCLGYSLSTDPTIADLLLKEHAEILAGIVEGIVVKLSWNIRSIH